MTTPIVKNIAGSGVNAPTGGTYASVLNSAPKLNTSIPNTTSGIGVKGQYLTGQPVVTSPISVPTPKPTATINSNTAKTKANEVIKPIVDSVEQKTTIAANTPSPYNDVRDSNGLLMNPPGALYDRNTGALLNQKTDTKKETPTPEQSLADQPEDGYQKSYNTTTGERQDQPEGTLPTGFSSLNPKERTDVSDEVSGEGGIVIKKFSDGTYGRFNVSTGTYSPASSADFNAAKRLNDAYNEFENLKKGIYSAEQQTQIDGINAAYGDLIGKQKVLNDNITGGMTVAQNMYGMGGNLIGQGEITKTVQDGIKNIKTLQDQMLAAVAKMKAGFKADNIELIKSSYDIYAQSEKDIQDNLDLMSERVERDQNAADLKAQSYVYQMMSKYPGAGITPLDTPQTTNDKLKKDVTFVNEQKQKSGAVDQSVVDGAMAVFKKTGALPTGFSAMTQNLKNAIYAAIGGNTGIVDDAVLNKATLDGKKRALSTQENQLAGAKTAIETLDKTLDLAQTYSNKVDRTGMPIAAKYALYLKGKVAGDADTAAFAALIKTASNEYAKIMTGAASSISGATVSSTEDAEKLINGEMSRGQIDAVIQILKQDARFRLESQENTINSIRTDIKDIGSTASMPTPTGGTTSDSAFSWDALN